MRITIPYGEKEFEVNIQKDKVIDIIEPSSTEISDWHKKMEEALNNPVESSSFEEFIENKERLLFIVNDANRPTPTGKVIEQLYEKLQGRQLRIIIATGSHDAPTEAEKRCILGKYYEELRDFTYLHDSDESCFITKGITSRGTKVKINGIMEQADGIVTINSVEPHYFAGFTGGRKSFLPGISAYSTIEQNHSHALSDDANPLALNGNPVNEDMIESARIALNVPCFSIQLVLDKEDEIHSVEAGDLFASFSKAVESAKDIYAFPVEEKADIIMTVVSPPLDANLYQSLKAVENAKLALKEDGILILVAACKEGIGPDKFYKLISSCECREEVIEKANNDYKLGYHKSSKLAKLSRIKNLWGVTDVKDDMMEEMYFETYDYVNNALDKAIDKKGQDCKILLVFNGAKTVPFSNL